MANRIYIAIGLIAILVLGGAFIVPGFIDWNAYKDRMQAMASEALGVEVVIAGDMEFTMLPQPRMRLNDIRLGPADNPVGSARAVVADFSLMDFLRDRFNVTGLVVTGPQVNLVVDGEGRLEAPITLAETATATNVWIADARFEDGTIRVSDARSGEVWQADGVSADMRTSGMRGPFTLQGRALYEGAPYTVRLGTSAMNSEGAMQITAYVRPESGAYSVATEGLLETGTQPRFDGQLTYRQAPVTTGDEVVGNLVLESPLVANTTEILLNGFTLLPNEDQATTRLTGYAAIALGQEPRFNAVVSGGVVTLLPGVVEDPEPDAPFELIRLLRALPEPLIPPIPGRIGMDIGELGLRGVGLREVRLDATTNGEVWSVEELSGRLAGETQIVLSGVLARAAGWPVFEGSMTASSARLDALSQLWRRSIENNPLFNMRGGLNARIRLANDSLRLTEGRMALDDTTHDFELAMRFGDDPQLDLHAGLSALSSGQSAALLALLPPIDTEGAFGASFPRGQLNLEAEAGAVLGQAFSDVALTANWSGEGIGLDDLRIGNFGGVGFEGAAEVSGTLEEPHIAGAGRMHVARGAGALSLLTGGPGSDNPLHGLVTSNLPAQFDVVLDPVGREGIQSLRLEGRAGVADLVMRADFNDGIAAFGSRQVGFDIEAMADSGAQLLAQLGLAPIISGEDGVLLAVTGLGNPSSSIETEITLEGGGERIDFSGSLMTSDLSEIRGQGIVYYLFEEMDALADLAGSGGIYLPGAEGVAELSFVGEQSLTLSDISAFSGDAEILGNLSFTRQSRSALLSGNLWFSELDVGRVAAMIGGSASRATLTPGLWPDGPFDIGQTQRNTRGRVAVSSPVVMADDEPLISDVSFDYTWDAEEVRVRALGGDMGGGRLEFEAALCCASQLADKSITGRFRLEEVALGSILPDTPGGVIDGRLTAGGQFQGNGQSYRELFGGLNGSGSFSVYDLMVDRLSPEVFTTAAGLDNIIELEPETLEDLVVLALDSGPFEAEETGGSFSLTGGTLRVSNVAMDGSGARLLGGGSLALDDLTLGSDWTLALTRPLTGNGLITETTGRIGVNVAGPFEGPDRRLDLAQMVDAIQMRAYEMELDELERLRAAQEARLREAAEEQARLMEEEARRQAEELLRQQQEQAAQEEAEALAEIERQLNTAQPIVAPQAQPDEADLPEAPLDLSLPQPGDSIFNLPPSVTQP